jgi:para-aminobenzoate synthetase component I
MQSDTVIQKMNEFGASGTPFLFMIDFEMECPVVYPVSELLTHGIFYQINGKGNYTTPEKPKENVSLQKFPIPYCEYKTAFDKAYSNLMYGNSYLLNLTKPTRIKLNLSLDKLFDLAHASYKLLSGNDFIMFSPETFIRTEGNFIYSYPMKGTIDAAIENASETILNNEKEMAEHYTIVDLIRNDLSIVSKNVEVTRFRYIDRIKTSEKNLLQVSSEIRGELPENWQSSIGSILFSLLPAGSICGAPKKKTVEIIKEAEQYKRGFYTGVFGVFDGKTLDSAVMIRFIENINGELYYKSGGGITVNSYPVAEYNEMLDKIYVPIV